MADLICKHTIMTGSGGILPHEIVSRGNKMMYSLSITYRLFVQTHVVNLKKLLMLTTKKKS